MGSMTSLFTAPSKYRSLAGLSWFGFLCATVFESQDNRTTIGKSSYTARVLMVADMLRIRDDDWLLRKLNLTILVNISCESSQVGSGGNK